MVAPIRCTWRGMRVEQSDISCAPCFSSATRRLLHHATPGYGGGNPQAQMFTRIPCTVHVHVALQDACCWGCLGFSSSLESLTGAAPVPRVEAPHCSWDWIQAIVVASLVASGFLVRFFTVKGAWPAPVLCHSPWLCCALYHRSAVQVRATKSSIDNDDGHPNRAQGCRTGACG